jgi:maltose O-acetyltransferase
MLRYFLLTLYYGLLRFLPSSASPGGVGKITRRMRYWCCRGLFRKCGTNVNVERRAHFNSGRNIEIGDHSGLGINCVINGPVKLGRYVMMGPEVIIYRSSHRYTSTDRPMCLQGFDTDFNQLVIEDDVWIGARVIVLPSCRRVGCGAIVGAGAVLTKNVPPYTVFAGNPAREIKSRKR